ncbi:uncharacterized protein LOC123015812 [Tribolium madens]|uniref:uncharacterized protein LOC123015812 n=1 Tax=Tribolium madens TaxID=41895 RepID=UPI001CF73FB1|nr:uncharacterized protein LOC123015812 [Tribolium madens]
MSPRASSDFGLYKEKLKENNMKSIKFIFIIIVTVPFLLLILYGVSTLLTREPDNFESTIEKPAPNAEKLVVSQSIKRDFYQNSPPKPFGVTFRGQPPSEFTSTTEKITTLNYPQLNFRHRHYPNNIQEVIGYGGRFHPPTYQVKYSNYYTQSQSQNVPKNQRSTRNFSLDENDPFYLYKPQDPGDVNLLATSSLRFAPPIWSNLKPKSQIPRVYFPQQYQENTHRQEIYNYPNKPLRVTLNVYPNENEQRQGLRQFINHKIENLQSKIRFPETKHKKMVIHVNLYPDEFRQGESKMYRNVLTTTPAT